MNQYMDHRQIADEMELYCLNEEVGAGLPIWLPNGEIVRRQLMALIESLEDRDGYQRVSSPPLAKSSLYEKSGHLAVFRDNMFPEMRLDEAGEAIYLRPMNCPHHHLIFGRKPRSYRELPFRLAEFGQVFRFEHSGALRGLIRARALCQNDAHIYVLPAQAGDEIQKVLRLNLEVLKLLGLENCRYRLSCFDPARPEEFHGDPMQWKHAEEILREALQALSLPFFEAPGEAAFYGPKIDIQFELPDGRDESIASVQLDFNSGAKFSLEVVNAFGEKEVPWIVHRAPMGSFERVVAVLLEHHQGRLPGWLAPVQVAILPISPEFDEEANRLASELKGRVRAKVFHAGGGSLGLRLRACHRMRVFSHIVLGKKERESGRVKLVSGGLEHLLSRSEILGWLEKALAVSSSSSLP